MRPMMLHHTTSDKSAMLCHVADNCLLRLRSRCAMSMLLSVLCAKRPELLPITTENSSISRVAYLHL